MWELKSSLSSAHNTSPGPDGIPYEMLVTLKRGFTIKSSLPIQSNLYGAGVSSCMERGHSNIYPKTRKRSKKLSQLPTNSTHELHL
ncbi:hypothetical protein TNCV_4802771 [Trichonephila clavipes]|nr:hypothetical protein TNCV_4802771 [Trichonephila clavipes]